MTGWIINYATGEVTREDRDQPPVLVLDSGDYVFEVWFWESDLRRWFVLAARSQPTLQAQGVVYFSPDQIEGGKDSVIGRYVRGMKQ